MREKIRETFSKEELAVMSNNLFEYGTMFHSSEVKGHCVMIGCGYPLFEYNSKFTSEFGDICTLCYDLIQALRFSKAGSYFAELHRLWQQGRRNANESGGTATEDQK
jgi:hypothetical protein